MDKTWTVGTILIALFICVALSVILIPAGNVGVVTRFGAVNRVAYPGISAQIPIIEGAHRMSTRTEIYTTDAAAASMDLQTVTSRVAVNYRLDGQYAVDVYQNIGRDYLNVVIAPAVQNTFKATTSKFKAEALITQREQVRVQAEADLKAQLAPYHIIIENFNIVNFDFSPEFNAAIENKVVKQQEVETAKQVREKMKIEAETAVIEAKGKADAQAAYVHSQSLTPEYLQFLFLSKWNGILPNVMGGTTPFIDVSRYMSGEQR